MSKETILLGSDHGGLELKNIIKNYLETTDLNNSYELKDIGTYQEDSVDYPDYAKKMAETIQENKNYIGILFCGTGIGMSIMANRYKGVRAALVFDTFTAKMAKEHNNANIICIGGRTTNKETAKELVKTWLTGKFEGGRHQKRIDKFDN
jgi:ribose 5-phosphate isomerase B